MIVMQKSKPIFSQGQQSKFQQLQLEVTALEAQLDSVLKEDMQLDNYAHSAIPLVYVSDRTAKTGIRLTQDVEN